ncbi:hypothetical protein [Bdellovibrio bacteriovorus]|uniref:hypothetical protein n=1 Tax=Bdellovibrio bacteriovorus TaxID=959 RepID=UPI0035A59B10
MKRLVLALAAVSMFHSFPAYAAINTANIIQVQATVVSVDQKSRKIVLKIDSGEEVAVVAGDEVRNFAQIKKGDVLKVDYQESLAWDIKKGGGAPVAMSESTEMDEAQPGQKPAARMVNQVTATGTVIKVNSKAQAITVKGPERTIVLQVPKPDVLKSIKVGDQIQASYTEAMAVSVESVKK